MVKIPVSLESVYSSFANAVVKTGTLGGRVTSKLCEQGANTNRLMYAVEFIFGSFALFFPKSAKIGCANMLGFSNSLQILGISDDVKNFLDTPLSAYTNPKTRLEAFKNLYFVTAGGCAILKIADELSLLSLGKLASKTGSWALFSLPFSDANHKHFHNKLCNCRLDTIFYSSLAIGFTLSLCNTFKTWYQVQAAHAKGPQPFIEDDGKPVVYPSTNEPILAQAPKLTFTTNGRLGVAFDLTSTATYLSLLVGEKLFPKQQNMVSGLLAVTSMAIGWAKTYYLDEGNYLEEENNQLII